MSERDPLTECPECGGTGRACCGEPVPEDRSMSGHPMMPEWVCCGDFVECNWCLDNDKRTSTISDDLSCGEVFDIPLDILSEVHERGGS